jgi:hypothetical protein
MKKNDIILIYGEYRQIPLQRGKRTVNYILIEMFRRLAHTIDIYRKLLETGSWNATDRRSSKPVTHEANEIAVLGSTVNNPCISIRQIGPWDGSGS